MDHVIDPAAPHGAGHDHHHDHGHGPADYYLEQLLTIFICGAFGIVAILMYQFDMLKYILAEKFRLPVLIGGVGLLVITAVRGVSLWRSVGLDADVHAHHDHAHHNHAPGEECDHPSHGPEEADHTAEDHEHGNIYWRIVVLLFPILLFLMGLPNQGLSKNYLDAKLGKDGALSDLKDVADRGGEATYDFSSLTIAAESDDKRRSLEGTPAKIKGQLRHIPGSADEFSLFYMKMNCCGPDAVALKARIKVDRPSLADAFKKAFPADAKAHQWVEVSGIIQFAKMENGGYVTVLRIKDANGIVATAPVY